MADRSSGGGHRHHLPDVRALRAPAAQSAGGANPPLRGTGQRRADGAVAPPESAGAGHKHFLFFFSDTGGGHRACAEAVAEAVAEHGRADVTLVDIFRASQRFPFTRFPELWPVISGGRGRAWGLFYRLSNHPLLVRSAHTAFWPYVRRALLTMLITHPADLIVSFHGIPNLSLLWAWRALPHQPPLVSVTQDLISVHAAFFPPGFDLYFVPTETARRKAIGWGIAPERIRAIGNPVRPSLVRDARQPQQQARRRLGLDEQARWVLITGGGDGRGGIARILSKLARLRAGTHVIVITGRNEALRRRLHALQLPLHLRIEGFVERMGLWLNAADVVVTKAGPNALAELFIAGRPAVLFRAIPGQETGNVTYAVEGGAARWAPTPDAAAHAIIRLLEDDALRRRMGSAARRLARPQAAATVAEALFRLVEAR